MTKPADMANVDGLLTTKHSRCFMAKANLTAQYLRQILNYEPETGIFRWAIVRRPSPFKPGDRAGTIDKKKGHLIIKINGKSYKAHRLAWLYVTGEWPTTQLDHKNITPADNRLDNLRECTTAINCQNQGMRKNNRSGFPGVYWHKKGKRWIASISVNMKRIHLGYFDDLEEAGAAYMKAKLAFHVHSPAFKT